MKTKLHFCLKPLRAMNAKALVILLGLVVASSGPLIGGLVWLGRTYETPDTQDSSSPSASRPVAKLLSLPATLGLPADAAAANSNAPASTDSAIASRQDCPSISAQPETPSATARWYGPGMLTGFGAAQLFITTFAYAQVSNDQRRRIFFLDHKKRWS